MRDAGGEGGGGGYDPARYLSRDDGRLPEASGQAYSIASVFVFEIEDGLIARLSHYRNSRLFERELAG